MRVPQHVSDRLKEVPAQALRGVFAGIGQVLLLTDRLRNKTPAHQQVPQARRPERPETAAPAASAAAPAPAAAPVTAPAPAASRAAPAPRAAATEARDFDKTGNVRLLDGTGAGASHVAKITTEKPAGSAGSVGPAEATAPRAPVAGEAELPVPNYDALSIASLRARLRNLDVTQLKQLAEYERAHADRADVIAMFERRVAKLQAETTPEERGEAEAGAEVEAQEDVAAEVQEEVGAEAEGEA